MADDIREDLAELIYNAPAEDGFDNDLSWGEAKLLARSILESPVIARIRAEVYTAAADVVMDGFKAPGHCSACDIMTLKSANFRSLAAAQLPSSASKGATDA